MRQVDLYNEELMPSPWRHTWITFRANHIALVALILISVVAIFALLAPVLTPHDPLTQNIDSLLVPPSWNDSGSILHPFGTDALGRDLFSRIVYGCRTTLGSSLVVVAMAMAIGVSLGAFAGMLSGVRSSILNHLLDALMAIPTLLIAIIIIAIMGVGLFNSMIAIVLALIPQFIHSTREFVRQEMQKDYLIASRLDGATKWQQFYFSILPNMIEMLVVQGTLALYMAIINVSALGFLRLGAQSPMPELGNMIAESLEIAYVAPWNVALPGLTIYLLTLAVNLIGDGVRSALRKRRVR